MSAPGAPPRLRPHGALVAATLVLMTAIAVESFAVTTVMPVVAADLGGLGWFSLATAATVTTGLIGTVAGGAWVDRSGTTVPLAVGGAVFVGGIVVCVVAPDMTTFVLGRLLQGFGGGIDAVVVYVLIASRLPPELRPRMFGLLTAAWLLPAVAGPLAAGVAAEVLGWRAVFGVVAVVAAVALGVLLVVTRGGSGGVAGPLLVRRVLYAALAAAAILGLHVAGHAAAPWSVVASSAALVVLLVAASRLLPVGTLRGGAGAPRLIALRAVMGATVVAAEAYLPLHLQVERGYSPAAAGVVVAIGALGWVAGAWWQGRRGTTRADDAVILRRAMWLLPVGPVTTLLVVAGWAPVAVAAVGGVVMGAAMGTAYPRISSAVLGLASAAERGEHSSALQAAEAMAAAAFLAVTGAVLATVSGPLALVVAYVVVSGVALGAVALGRGAVGAAVSGPTPAGARRA